MLAIWKSPGAADGELNAQKGTADTGEGVQGEQ